MAMVIFRDLHLLVTGAGLIVAARWWVFGPIQTERGRAAVNERPKASRRFALVNSDRYRAGIQLLLLLVLVELALLLLHLLLMLRAQQVAEEVEEEGNRAGVQISEEALRITATKVSKVL